MISSMIITVLTRRTGTSQPIDVGVVEQPEVLLELELHEEDAYPDRC